uniref:CAZy families CBM48/GH13 protein n=1 Tax=uncultured Frankia sp. TaxID=181582 RepID=A0A060BYS7_9ACTN|nr:CAZy families CBM48/GH13 protein [uncultured Frankia sp.]
MRHNPYKLLLDPYARAISGRIQHGPELYDYDPATDCTGFNCEMSRLDSAGHTVRGVVLSPSFSAAGNKPHHPWDHTVIYEAHVKGLTMHLPGCPPTCAARTPGWRTPRQCPT